MELIILSAAILLLLAAIAASSGKRSSKAKAQGVNPSLIAGMYYLADDDDERALTELREVLLAGNAAPEVYLATSVLLRKRGELTKAIHLGEGQLCHSLPRELYIIILRELMRCYRAAGTMHRASQWIEGMSERELGPEMLLIQADMFSEKGDHENAIKKYRKYASVSKKSCDKEIALEYIEASQLAADKSHKIKALRNATQADPRNRKAYFILAEAYFEDKRKDLGIAELNKAIENELVLDRNDMKKLEELFYQYSTLDKLYEKMSERVSDNSAGFAGTSYPIPYLFLSELYIKKGDQQKAADLLKDYIIQHGPTAIILRSYARISADPVLVRAARLDDIYVCSVCGTKYAEYIDICSRCGSLESLRYM